MKIAYFDKWVREIYLGVSDVVKKNTLVSLMLLKKYPRVSDVVKKYSGVSDVVKKYPGVSDVVKKIPWCL